MVGLRAWRRGQHPDVEIPNRSVSPHYRLLLIDLRDHGYSKDILPEFPEYDFDIVGEDILAVIDHLGIEKAHFVSLSIGSVILQKIGHRASRAYRPDGHGRSNLRWFPADALVCAQWQTAQLRLAVSGHLLVVQFHRAAAQEPPHEPLDFPPSESAA